MARFHLHVAVSDLQDSIRFYSALFGQPASVERDDYAKWQLSNPPLNFAISRRGHRTGVNHVGFQAETAEEFARLQALSQSVEAAVKTESAEAHCCYAKSEKYWVVDPQGLAWEHFLTLESIPVFGDDEVRQGTQACCSPHAEPAREDACCVPRVASGSCC